ncbi:YeeE/YedE family protein [Labrys portucalensis]|uniref:YeeE/YedE family protein n=1 Tax=Labrys neptuniae TaxID=376174 RepID=A0ABV6ZJ28_9HYPH
MAWTGRLRHARSGRKDAMAAYWNALFGGMLIGAAAVLLLLANGRVAGISGIAGRLLAGQRVVDNGAFVVGLVLGPIVLAVSSGSLPAMTVSTPWPLVVLAGLLVGFGTRMGSGCTSGHGIIGLARFSRRSIAATAMFLGGGLLTASLLELVR